MRTILAGILCSTLGGLLLIQAWSSMMPSPLIEPVVSKTGPMIDGVIHVPAGTPSRGTSKQSGWMWVTAYCKESCCCGEYADGVTANGHRIQPGDKFCAADPGICFGTMFTIPDYGKVPCYDRGGAIKGAKLDVYFDTHQEALEWGRQRLKVEVTHFDKWR